MTPKQEAFVRAYLESGNASGAYRIAYDAENMKESAINTNAYKLLRHAEVAQRIAAARNAVAVRHDITVDSITQMLKEDRDLARKSGQVGAAVSAVMGIAKLHGLIIDKKEVTKKRDAADFSDNELLEIARLGRQGTASAEGSSQEPDRVH